MRRLPGRTVEVESLEEFDARLEAGARDLRGWHVQSVDLTERTEALARLDLQGAVFLGCRLADEPSVREAGALVFPALPETPVDGYRATLYTADELYAGLDSGYDVTLDARAYAWSRRPPEIDATLARALHDHAIDDALREWASGRRLVGVMGGHAVQRGTEAYADAARLGRALAEDHVLATGGGPGAMEAANLGAWLSSHPPPALDEAVDALAGTPSFRPSVATWVRGALAVRARWPGGAESLGVPTWFYGHEPPNVFATAIAKYFANAIREDVLLRLCSAGIVFLPGSAGTVQEVFQEACENYYADPSATAPMVLVGREHWTRTLPVWPLLERLADGRDMAAKLHLVDTVEEACAALRGG